MVLEPPSRILPVELDHCPVNVWVKPVPKFNVPPLPLKVNPAPPTLPVNVAVPAVLVIETNPVVVKPPILCVPVPEIIIGVKVPIKVPVLVKFPAKVTVPVLALKVPVLIKTALIVIDLL